MNKFPTKKLEEWKLEFSDRDEVKEAIRLGNTLFKILSKVVSVAVDPKGSVLIIIDILNHY